MSESSGIQSLFERTCSCGHSADWHSHSGKGDCEHNAECRCAAFDRGDCTNGPDEHGNWPCDPKVISGLDEAECQACGRVAAFIPGGLCDYRFDPESRCDGKYDADGRCDQCGRPSIFEDYDPEGAA